MDLKPGETPWKHRITTESQAVRDRRLGVHRASSGASRLRKVRERAVEEFRKAGVKLHEAEFYDRRRVKTSHAASLRAIAEAQRWQIGRGDLVTSWEGSVS